MFTRIVKQGDMQNVAVNQTSIGRVTIRKNLHAVWLRFLTSAGVELTRAQIIADLSTELKVRLNGTVIWDGDVTLALDLQKYYGDSISAGNVDGMVPIFFNRVNQVTAAERSVTALGPIGIDEITVEAKMGSSFAQLAKVEIYAEVDELAPREIGRHVRVTKHPKTFGSTGAEQIVDLPYKDTFLEGIFAMHYRYSTGAIDNVSITRNGQIWHQTLSAKHAEALLKRGRRTPQSGYHHIDFERNNDLLSYLPVKGMNEFLVDNVWKTAAPNSYTIWIEKYFTGFEKK